MKKHVYFLVICTAVLFSACSADDSTLSSPDSSNTATTVSEDTTNVPVFSSIEEMEEYSNIKALTRYTPPPSLLSSSTVDITTKTVTGYTSVSFGSQIKGIFVKAFAKDLGLQSGKIYIDKMATICYKTTISSGAYPVTQDSPNCGYIPNGSNYAKGYSLSYSNNELILTTGLVYVITDLSGIDINQYYPRDINSLQWTYGLVH